MTLVGCITVARAPSESLCVISAESTNWSLMSGEGIDH